ncbi:glycosyltransferase family 8 protein [Sodiomyces alcalophilus JCM 7366]|uniref:glycosyltransferase family 8 protein n=1 Tax=Sodiomyces alcalophilus JCM 7366 TaxID=591952 RepID=UPI0039B568BE
MNPPSSSTPKIYTVLITNEAYLPGLFTLEYSLRKHGSRYPLVALYTDTVPASAHQAIDRRGIPKQRIEYLLPTKGRDYSNDPRFYDCWSKLTPFSLTQYSRVVQLDADMLVRHNIDDLMTLPLDDPAVSSDPANASRSTRVFAAGHACSLLSDLFRGRWVPLPYVYNALKTLRWPGVHDAIWRDDHVRVVHYILAPKPWDEQDPDGRWKGPANPDDEVTHRWWAEYDAERRAAERERGIQDGF